VKPPAVGSPIPPMTTRRPRRSRGSKGPRWRGFVCWERGQSAVAEMVPRELTEAKQNFRNFYRVDTASPPMARFG
jgi:hypothetical protein